jgi:hypothetical protein
MEYKISLADSTHSDRNNCALNAVSIALSKPYYEVYRVFRLVGRRGGKGSSIKQITDAVTLLKIDGEAGMTIDKIKDKVLSLYKPPTYVKITLDKFAKMYPTGKFIVIKSRHALALVDGVWYDNTMPNPRAYVKCFYRVE